MENKLWLDIQAQGENLKRVVGHLYGPEREAVESAAQMLRPDRQTVFIGVASAEYLCMPAAVYLAQRGWGASTMKASDAFYTTLPALRSSNVVINTRSGETVEVVRLARALKDEGIPFVTITNEPGSTVAKLAARVVWASTWKDELVSINVVTGMMTATLTLAAAMTGELDAMREPFFALADQMGPVVERASRQADAFFSLLRGVRPLYLLYRGHSMGAAYCGRLALEEIARTPSVAMECAEFRQGPNEVIDDRFGAVLFVPEGKPGELNLSLAEDIRRCGGRVLLVGSVEREAAGDREIVFPIQSIGDILRPVLEVVPVQTLAYRLAAGQGYAPGTVRYISKVILSEEGIPNQSA